MNVPERSIYKARMVAVDMDGLPAYPPSLRSEEQYFVATSIGAVEAYLLQVTFDPDARAKRYRVESIERFAGVTVL